MQKKTRSARVASFFMGKDLVEVRSMPNADGLLPGVVPPAYNSRTVVGINEALTISAVYRSVSVINNIISQMTVVTKRGIEIVDTPSVVSQPDPNATQYQFIKRTISSLALTGNAYWKIVRRPSDKVITSLVVIDPLTVQVSRNDNGRKKFSIGSKDYTDNEVIHIMTFEVPGRLTGLGPLEANASGLSATLDLRAYADGWFANSGNPKGGYLTTNEYVDTDNMLEVRTRWQQQMNDGLPPGLPTGWEWKTVNLNPADALFIEQQQFAVTEVARWFGIPAGLLLADSGATGLTYQNLQADEKNFILHTLTEYTAPIADALSAVLPRGTTVEFNTDSLLKANTKDRYDAYAVADFLTINEKRALENLKPVAGGDALSIAAVNSTESETTDE